MSNHDEGKDRHDRDNVSEASVSGPALQLENDLGVLKIKQNVEVSENQNQVSAPFAKSKETIENAIQFDLTAPANNSAVDVVVIDTTENTDTALPEATDSALPLENGLDVLKIDESMEVSEDQNPVVVPIAKSEVTVENPVPLSLPAVAKNSDVVVIDINTNDNNSQIKLEHPVNAIKLEDPGSIFKWREDLIADRQAEEIDGFVQHQIAFNYNSTQFPNHVLTLLQTCPTKFVFYHCLQAMYTALQHKVNVSSMECLEQSIQILLRLKNIISAHSVDLVEFYDVDGFYYVVNATLNEILKILNSNENHQEGMLGKTDFEMVVMTWDDLSLKAKSVVLATKLYFKLLFRERIKELVVVAHQLLETTKDIPEWHYLFGVVLSRRRAEFNTVITKPKKAEMESLKAALELQPSNLMVWIQMLETLFDWMRTEDRHPRFEILGEELEDVLDIAYFLNDEIQQALAIKEIPSILALELNILASNFYGYRNLPQLTNSKISVKLNGELEIKSEGVEKKILRRDMAMKIANSCLKTALKIHPESAKGNLSQAFRYLKKFQRDEALNVLKSAVQTDPLNASLVLVYIRILLGGSREQREEAVRACDTSLVIASRHKWCINARVHLLFLKGCLFLLQGDFQQTVINWIHGLQINKKHFLKQFVYWSRTQVRKYMWPEAFTNFKMIEILKEELTARISSETPELEEPAAVSVLIEHINSCFPLTSSISQEIRFLVRQWYYLFDDDDLVSESDSESNCFDKEVETDSSDGQKQVASGS